MIYIIKEKQLFDYESYYINHDNTFNFNLNQFKQNKFNPKKHCIKESGKKEALRF